MSVTPYVAARRLLRASAQASLATQADGAPQIALVTPAWMADLSPVLLLSGLSRHTRQLRADFHCALLCVAPGEPDPMAGLTNPQTVARVSLNCIATEDDDPALRARYLAVHPYAALYADFADFGVWRLGIVGGQSVEGFGRAFDLPPERLLPPRADVAAVAAAAAAFMAHCNSNHAARLRVLAGDASGARALRPGDAWRMVGVDVDGADMIAFRNEQAVARTRLCWPQTAENHAALQHAFAALTPAMHEIS